MTTKVHIQCQDNSHWSIRVKAQCRVYDHEHRVMTDKWEEYPQHTFVLAPGGSEPDVYVHDGMRLIIEEIPNS